MTTLNLDDLALQPGEHYAGIVLDENGQAKHHLMLMARRPTNRMSWNDAMAWAQNMNATLPDLQEQALLYANCKPHLEPQWHSSCEAHESGASSAWYCNFYDGRQGLYRKSFKGSAVAVRRIPIDS